MIAAVIVLSATVLVLFSVLLYLIHTQARERRHLTNMAFSSTPSELLVLEAADNASPKPPSDKYQKAVDLNSPLGIQ